MLHRKLMATKLEAPSGRLLAGAVLASQMEILKKAGNVSLLPRCVVITAKNPKAAMRRAAQARLQI